MQETAFLLNELTVSVNCEETGRMTNFHYEKGLISFVEYINEDKTPLHKVINFTGTKNDIEVSIAMQYTDNFNENILSFVNNVKTIDGGSHEVGFKTGITKTFNDYAKANSLIKNGNFDGSDIREGLTAIINLKIPENLLQFEGQTKNKLGTPEARSTVESICYENLKFFLEENREIATKIIDKATKSKMAREAARKAREEIRNGKNKKAFEKNLSGKLSPATGKDASQNELFLVEGNSAGGSAKKARDGKFQAILPLRGKVINTEKANITDVLKNEEINTIIHTIGAGFGNDFEIEDCNYDKVIIMTDADFDGAHIQVLLLTFFYRFMRGLIEAGRLYIASAPLYNVETANKKMHYFWDINSLREFTDLNPNARVSRNKGLGEMMAEELKITTMDPTTRNLIRVTIEDIATAEKRVSVLMGDAVEPRKDWIDENVDFSLEDDYQI